MHNIKTNIQELNEQTPAPFSDDIILNYGTYLKDNDIYLSGRSEQYLSSIPLDRVVGIAQMYGDDATWGQCLKGRWLKRLDRRLKELVDNPNYYLSKGEPEHLSFIKIGDKYFISEGKHRTIIARFFAHFNPELFSERSPFERATVIEYFIDTEYASIRKRLDALAVRYPSLRFELEHTTKQNVRSFLLIEEKHSYGRLEAFNRGQIYHVLDALENPSVSSKWKAGRVGHSSNIYSFIPYATCFKALFGQRLS